MGVASEQVVCRQMILRRERDNSRSLDKGERIAKINYAIGVRGGGRGKGDVEFLGRGRLNYRLSHPLLPGCARQVNMSSAISLLFTELPDLSWCTSIHDSVISSRR